MQQVVNKALSHAGNDRHGNAWHKQGWSSAAKAVDAEVFGKLNLKGGWH